MNDEDTYLVHDYRILQMLKMLNQSIVSMDWVHVHTFLSMKEGSLLVWFCLFVMLRSPKPYGIVGKPSMSNGAMSRFHNVLTYVGEGIEYWKKFN